MLHHIATATLLVALLSGCHPTDLPGGEDTDGDGWLDEHDCEPDHAEAHPDNVEEVVCSDGLDNDCDGEVDELEECDEDGDGFMGNVDCDDADALVFPGQVEYCDGKDTNCTGLQDPVIPEDERDLDGDGFLSCTVLGTEGEDFTWAASIAGGGDCDDEDADVHPDGIEICGNGRNDDCDAEPDPVCPFLDAQGAPIEEWAGARWIGAEAGDQLGTAVSPGAGGVALGAPGACVESLERAGAVYVSSAPLAGSRVLSPGGGVPCLAGTEEGERAGASLSSLHDGHGGLGLLVGAPGEDPERSGRSSLVAEAASGTTPLADAGPVVTGAEPGDRLGAAIGDAGDLDADGHDDLVLGAPAAGGAGGHGAAYVFFGPLGGDLDAAQDADVVLIGGSAGDQAGSAASRAGRHDGGPYDDLVVGAAGMLGGHGAVYVLHGPLLQGDVDLAAGYDTRYLGESGGDRAGSTVAGAGDLDGDGLDDLLVGAPGADGGFGAVYVVVGALQPPTQASLADALVRISGDDEGSAVGASVAGAGDVDGDGRADVLVGAPGVANGSGALALYYGPFEAGGLGLHDADARFLGPLDAGLGAAVAGAGDLNGDGCDDLLAGGPGYDAGAGAAYLIYGGGASCAAPQP